MKKHIILSLAALSLTSNISQACFIDDDFSEEEIVTVTYFDYPSYTYINDMNDVLDENEALRDALRISEEKIRIKEDFEDMVENAIEEIEVEEIIEEIEDEEFEDLMDY